MIYYKCKCGKLESWSSMGATTCKVCKDCGTTMACNPRDPRTEPTPHDWYEEKSTITWRGRVIHKHTRSCLKCGDHEDLTAPELTTTSDAP